jgi:hypothetical protein
MTAAALLLTTSAASAPVMRRSTVSTSEARPPRFPVSRSISRLEYAPAIPVIAAIAARESGARPRFVCRITPVAA